jgi:hypothetical protein
MKKGIKLGSLLIIIALSLVSPMKSQISANYRYIERLSEKSKNGEFSNFAYYEINNL